TQHARRLRDGLDQERLAHPRLPNQHQVVLTPDTRSRRQLLDLHPVDRRAVELPVEGTQRLAFAPARLAEAMGDAPLPTLPCLLRYQPMQELLMRQSLTLRCRHPRGDSE